MHNLRKVTSLTALLAAVFIILTSIILYIVPQGRVAYWADWRLWGLTKTQWTNLHLNLGVLFLLAVALHTYLNWKPMLSYLKTKTKNLKIFTREFNLALAITLVFLVGTQLEVPPFSTIVSVGQGFKDRGAVKYGEPPYGHAELSSLKTFTRQMGWDLDESLQRLEQAGFKAGNDQATLQQLAGQYSTTPQQIYLAMQPPQAASQKSGLPQQPPPGIGRLTLADICREYGFNTVKVLIALEKEGKAATIDMPLKEIAAGHGMAPQDLYAVLKQVTDGFAD